MRGIVRAAAVVGLLCRCALAEMDYVDGMGKVLSSQPLYAAMRNPLGIGEMLQPEEIRSGIVNLLGLPVDEDRNDDLDNAPEADLQEAAGTSAPGEWPVTKDLRCQENYKTIKDSSVGKCQEACANTAGCSEFSYGANTHCRHAKDKSGCCDSKCQAGAGKNADYKGENFYKKPVAKVDGTLDASAKKSAEEAKAYAKELKQKGAMPPPPPQKGIKAGPHIHLGKMAFSADKVDSRVLHAKIKLSGKAIHGVTLKLDGNADIHGALHLQGDGSVSKSKVTGKELKTTVFVNKKNGKGVGIAVGDEGGFFDHNDGYITYEPLSGKEGLKVNANFRATGIFSADNALQLTGKGTKVLSKTTKRYVLKMIDPVAKQSGAGIAVSQAGGFFDFKDGSITYEPLEGSNGLRVNSELAVQKKAVFHGDLLVKGSVTVEKNINQGNAEQVASFHEAFRNMMPKYEQRIKELETTNAALVERMQRMETMMEQLLQQQR